MRAKLTGLVAATHTPFDAHGELNLSMVEKQAKHLLDNGVESVFIAGTTGECHSLTIKERLNLAERWSDVIRGTTMRLVVHVGSNCLADSRELAAQTQSLKAFAIAALAPSYFKPGSIETLVACCREIAETAPEIPFYYYDIPNLTGLHLSVADFLSAAPEHISTLAGIKFTNPDLMTYQKCLRVQNGRYDVLWGLDEQLLSALAVGATGAVGSSYNFAAPIYRRLFAAYSNDDLEIARAEQFRSVQLIDLLAGFGYMGAAKAVMGFLGVDVGPARLPNTNLDSEQFKALRAKLEKLAFFDWIRT